MPPPMTRRMRRLSRACMPALIAPKAFKSTSPPARAGRASLSHGDLVGAWSPTREWWRQGARFIFASVTDDELLSVSSKEFCCLNRLDGLFGGAAAAPAIQLTDCLSNR